MRRYIGEAMPTRRSTIMNWPHSRWCRCALLVDQLAQCHVLSLQARGIVLPMACVGLADAAKLLDGAIADISFGKTATEPGGSASSHVRSLYDRRRDVTDEMTTLLMLRSVQEMEHWVAAHDGASVVLWVKHPTTAALQARPLPTALAPQWLLPTAPKTDHAEVALPLLSLSCA